MASRFGHDVLSVFDVWDESREYLADIIEQNKASQPDIQQLFAISLLGGYEDFQYMVDCATSNVQCRAHGRSFTGNDVLTSIWCMLNRVDMPPREEAWQETDGLIERVKKQAEESNCLLARINHPPNAPTERRKQRPRKKPASVTSHYWASENDTSGGCEAPAQSHHEPTREPTGASIILPDVQSRSHACLTNRKHAGSTKCSAACPIARGSTEPMNLPRAAESIKKSGTSPYFADAPSKSPSRKRPPAGTVSCIPFPPLMADSFGIIQEKVAQEPFWLLIAITFLIKTSGQLAIPTFLRIKSQFPTPQDVADESNAAEILQMIQHLGLGQNRLKFMQKYARAFLEDPPRPNVLYRVRNYASREVSVSGDSLEMPTTDIDTDGWEIGHMTQGKYTIDSWRIFCRDELLGRAEDWNGKGREPEFQPEWMRVLPADKELRAYLRWMWMREGWEWNPATGECIVLREEMQRAVNEGRVEYDDTGGLRIIDAV
ncbi:hypothetical protein K4F52_008397 [Lecanicillium sp. MT-2017a]|nr:hypothetical protein K4F52_008397 [Lecanicillium sp. MT-2017a]